MKAPANCRLIGRWRIVEADLWDRDYLDLCGPATLTVTEQGGEIAFGAMEAGLDVEPGLERAEGDFAATVVGDRDRRRPAQVEMIAVPDVGLDDPPAADELAIGRRGHVGAATSLVSRVRL